MADRSRTVAVARLTSEVFETITTAERAATNPGATYRALTRQDRRRLRNLATTISALGEYLHGLGYELEVTLVPARQPRAAHKEAQRGN